MDLIPEELEDCTHETTHVEKLHYEGTYYDAPFIRHIIVCDRCGKWVNLFDRKELLT
jgi:hypothetical protein